MSKIAELVLNDPNVKRHDFIISLMAALCAIASLATKTFLTFSGGTGAIYVMAAGYFAIGGNLVLLAPKFVKSPIQNWAKKIMPFFGQKSNFAFILKTLGALGFFVAGIVEDHYGLAIGGAGFFFGNIIALVRGYKIYAIAGYGMSAGAFLTEGLLTDNSMMLYAGITAIAETVFLAVYKNHDESRSKKLKEVWEAKKTEIEEEKESIEELNKLKKRKRRNIFSNAFMSSVYETEQDSLNKYFDSEFSKYAFREKVVEATAKSSE